MSMSATFFRNPGAPLSSALAASPYSRQRPFESQMGIQKTEMSPRPKIALFDDPTWKQYYREKPLLLPTNLPTGTTAVTNPTPSQLSYRNQGQTNLRTQRIERLFAMSRTNSFDTDPPSKESDQRATVKWCSPVRRCIVGQSTEF